jgi:hypothetical protein
MVWVVPIHTEWMILGQLILIVEGDSRVNGQKNVVTVSVGRDVESVYVKVGGFVQLILNRNLHPVAWPHDPGWAGNSAIVGQCRGVASRDLRRSFSGC